MAVLIEAISVVIRTDVLTEKIPGGLDGFKRLVRNNTLCADNEIVRVGFMVPRDAEAFVNSLETMGLKFLRNGEAIDIAVVDQVRGPTLKCEWLEFCRTKIGDTEAEVSTCRLVGSKSKEVVTPPGWIFERSLSSTFGLVPTEHVQKKLKFLRHENGLDIYINSITGKEVYIGRTSDTREA